MPFPHEAGGEIPFLNAVPYASENPDKQEYSCCFMNFSV